MQTDGQTDRQTDGLSARPLPGPDNDCNTRKPSRHPLLSSLSRTDI